MHCDNHTGMSNTSPNGPQTTPPPTSDPTPAEVSERLLNDTLFAPIRAIVETAGIIYRLEMRTGYAEFLTFCEPTARGTEHELKALKGVAPAVLRCGAAKGQSTLLVYDRAIVDFLYAYNLTQSQPQDRGRH